MIGIDDACRSGRIYAGLSCRLPSLTAILFVAACSGGGGSGDAGSSSLKSNPSATFLDPVAEPSSPAVATDWSGSQEYLNSTGLAQLKAAEGYARRGGGLPGGQGVRIAIIDSGIDLSHPDLGNLAETSWTAGGEALTSDSHATFVAGIAGASRTQSGNVNDMHGMAYNATLVNFQASRPSETVANGYVSFSTDDLVDAIEAAAGLTGGSSAVESDILNLSLGASSASENTFAKLRTAMKAAAAEDKIMVLAAGNDGGTQPIYPAAYADDDGIAGRAIVVGNLTSSNQAAPSSSLCGDTRDYCLFAPGTTIRSTLDGDAYGIGSGTSFAAPYVAGAAAVVKAAFPGVSNRDVVDRLLLTAADLGPAGVDSTFGRGRLDLEAAMAPVGPTGLPIGPSVDGPVAPVAESGLRLGASLAIDEADRAFLGRAMAVDEMGFPFPVDLGEGVDEERRDVGLSAFIGGHHRSTATVGLTHAQITAFVDEAGTDGSDLVKASTGFRHQAEEAVASPLLFSAKISDDVAVFASSHVGSGARLGLEAGLDQRQTARLLTPGILGAFDDLVPAPTGAGLDISLADGTDLAVSAFGSLAPNDQGESTLQRFELRQSLADEVEMHLGLGLVQEADGFLGSRVRGAFGETSAYSHFMTISFLGPLTDDIDAFATYTRGRSSIDDAGDGLLSNWSASPSEAFGAGLVVRDVATDNDGFTVFLGQPLRQTKAEASVTLPVAREPDGSVVTANRRIDLAPDAREIVAEIGYRLPFGQGGDHDVEATGFFRLHPDHDRQRDPEAGLGLAYRLRF